jgi:hypothetical protein
VKTMLRALEQAAAAHECAMRDRAKARQG